MADASDLDDDAWTARWVLVLTISALLTLLLIGFLTAPLGIFMVGIWVLYRVLRGWSALRSGQPLP